MFNQFWNHLVVLSTTLLLFISGGTQHRAVTNTSEIRPVPTIQQITLTPKPTNKLITRSVTPKIHAVTLTPPPSIQIPTPTTSGPQNGTVSPTPTYIPVSPTPFSTPQLSTPSPTPIPENYWESFGPKGYPDSNINTAENLLSFLNTKGYKAIEIERYKNGGWDGHIYQLPFNNFEIKQGEGYMIKFALQPSNTWRGWLTFGNTLSPFTIPLSMGWNFISLPSDFRGDITTAEKLCLAISSKGGSVTEVLQLTGHTNLDSGSWSTHTCGSDENSFTLNDGEAYYVKMNQYASLILPL